VAGISSLLPEEALRPDWITYVAVESADVAATRAREAGGVIVVEPFDASPCGRIAVLRDPAGAAFGIWQAGLRSGAQLVNEPSAWAMSTLNTDDPEGAPAFYRALFGWEPAPSGPRTTLFRLPGTSGESANNPFRATLVAVMRAADGDPRWSVDILVATWIVPPRLRSSTAEQRGQALRLPRRDSPRPPLWAEALKSTWLRAIAEARVAFAMTLRSRCERAQTTVPVFEPVLRPGTLRAGFLVRRCRRLHMEARVAARSFAHVRLVGLAPIGSRCDVVGPPPVRSHELLEALVAAPAFDHDAAVRRRPDDGPGDQGLPGEGPEAVPDGRLERVAKLVASSPPLDVDQLVAIEPTQHDPVRPTTAASPAAEGDGGDGRSARLELLPDRLSAQELMPYGPKPRSMDARRLAPGRSAAWLPWEGLTRRARTCAPPARDVELGAAT
jgi:predicted enzyme related to lactoylglutathione lyase